MSGLAPMTESRSRSRSARAFSAPSRSVMSAAIPPMAYGDPSSSRSRKRLTMNSRTPSTVVIDSLLTKESPSRRTWASRSAAAAGSSDQHSAAVMPTARPTGTPVMRANSSLTRR